MKVLIFFLPLILAGCVIKSVDISPTEVGLVEPGYRILRYGSHILPFYETVIIYETLGSKYEDDIDMLTSDDMSVSGSFYMQFQPDPGRVDSLHRKFGKHYKDIVVVPETRASIRKIFLDISSDSLILLEVDEIQTRIYNDLERTLDANYVRLSGFKMEKLILPTELDIVKRLGLENEYRTIRTSSDWTAKRVAIDAFLKNKSKDALRVILQLYADHKDETTRSYIAGHLIGYNL